MIYRAHCTQAGHNDIVMRPSGSSLCMFWPVEYRVASTTPRPSVPSTLTILNWKKIQCFRRVSPFLRLGRRLQVADLPGHRPFSRNAGCRAFQSEYARSSFITWGVSTEAYVPPHVSHGSVFLWPLNWGQKKWNDLTGWGSPELRAAIASGHPNKCMALLRHYRRELENAGDVPSFSGHWRTRAVGAAGLSELFVVKNGECL